MVTFYTGIYNITYVAKAQMGIPLAIYSFGYVNEPFKEALKLSAGSGKCFFHKGNTPMAFSQTSD